VRVHTEWIVGTRQTTLIERRYPKTWSAHPNKIITHAIATLLPVHSWPTSYQTTSVSRTGTRKRQTHARCLRQQFGTEDEEESTCANWAIEANQFHLGRVFFPSCLLAQQARKVV